MVGPNGLEPSTSSVSRKTGSSGTSINIGVSNVFKNLALVMLGDVCRFLERSMQHTMQHNPNTFLAGSTSRL
jgi:hypothetical protein